MLEEYLSLCSSLLFFFPEVEEGDRRTHRITYGIMKLCIERERNRDDSKMSDGCLARGGGGKKVAQGFWERQRERNLCVCAMCYAPLRAVYWSHRQTSYLPAVRMLQRLQHTAAIVLPLGQAHSYIILLLSLV